MSGCRLCPRKCGARREDGKTGACHVTNEIKIARIAPHFYEEPFLSGTKGSGAVFFCGCSLGCRFCQNKAISRGNAGRVIGEAALADELLALADSGVHNINLVTPTHYTAHLSRVLAAIKPQLKIPVVWNSSGYECADTLRLLEGLVDIYLPDFKYIDPALAAAYSGAPDYAVHATAAIAEMYRQVGAVRTGADGMLCSGVVVRHLVLPACRHDSIAVLDRIAKTLPVGEIRLSLLRQYTPDFADEDAPANLKRRVTTFEYEAVLQHACTLGFLGVMQGKDAAKKDYTPHFDV